MFDHNNVNPNANEWQKIVQFEKRIVYGAGVVAQELISVLKKRGIPISVVAVSEKKLQDENISDCEVYKIDELLEYKNDALLIVAVTNRYKREMSDYAVLLGFSNILLIDTDRLRIENWK